MTGLISRGSPRVRVTVVRQDVPRGPLRVGDQFEFVGSRLILPDGMVLPGALLATLSPLVGLRQGDLPADNWLVRKPYLCGPDAEENLIMHVEAIHPEEEL